MVEHTDSSADVPESVATSLTRRERARLEATRTAARPPVRGRKIAKATTRAAPARTARSAAKPARSLAILAVVGGLVVTVALPAYGAWRPSADAMTLHEVAENGAQSLVVASDATTPVLERESYSATTAEEIEKKKAEEAAAVRARQQAAAVAASVDAARQAPRVHVDLTMAAPGSGEVRWPVTSFTLGDGFGSRGGSHEGIDLLAPAGTPIYAAAAGVVRMSQESLGGYGVAVVIDHVIGGQSVTTTYGHMIYGSRQVAPGQSVEAGQLIGLVGSTGRSTANHLHFETRISGQLVDPWSWLQSNAG